VVPPYSSIIDALNSLTQEIRPLRNLISVFH